MKTIVTTILIFLSITIGTTQISQQEVSASFGTQNAFVVEHQGATAKHTESAWKDFMKTYSKKTKYNRKSGMWETEKAEMSMLSNKDLTVYMKIAEGNGMTRSSVFIDNGMVFLDGENSSDLIPEIESMLTEYQNMTYTLVVEDEVDQEESNLKDMEKDLEKLKKQNEKYHEQIAEFEKKIAETEDAIVANIGDQDTAEIKIDEQKDIIESVKTKLNNIGKN